MTPPGERRNAGVRARRASPQQAGRQRALTQIDRLTVVLPKMTRFVR